ncbi:hypothetical protein RSAG8_07864, partial [Rhizoctonia solani AG-8 WAC10335]
MACPPIHRPNPAQTALVHNSRPYSHKYPSYTLVPGLVLFIPVFYINPFRFLSLAVVSITTVYSLSFCPHPRHIQPRFFVTNFY